MGDLVLPASHQRRVKVRDKWVTLAAHQQKNEEDPTTTTPTTSILLLLSFAPPLFKSFIPAIAQQLRLCNLMATIPFEWDSSSSSSSSGGSGGRMRLLKSKFQLRACQLQMGLQVAYTLVMTGYFLSPRNQRHMKSSTRMVGFAFLVCFWTTMLTRLTFWDKKAQVAQLVNEYINFENKYLPASRSGKTWKGDPMSRALMTLGLLTSVGLPGLMCTILLVNPCKPPHLGFILFGAGSDEDHCLVPGWPIRLVILTWDTWMWANSIPPACFFAFQIFYLGLKCLSFYLQLVCSIFQNSAKIQIQITAKVKAKDEFCISRIYVHLRLLAKLYNFCLQSVFIPTQMTAACLVVIIGLYTCIKLHQEIPMPGFAFFPLLAMDGLSMIFISQMASQVYSRSNVLLMAARKSGRYKRCEWFQKAANGSMIIKIRFGQTNFIDKMSPLIYLNFCATQTVSLILFNVVNY